MKSQLRVDYKSRYGDGDFGDKEPVIRIDLIESDDPRDTLLKEIVRDDGFLRIAGSQINPSSDTNPKKYVIYRRGDRERLINDFASPIFTGLVRYSGIKAHFVTASEEMYFDTEDSKIRSKGLTNREIDEIKWSGKHPHEKDMAFIDRLIEEWKDFEQKVTVI